MRVNEVVIPAAGLGTRFLPFTKVVAKEMLPLLNKPAIEYIAQEAIESNINDILLIINKNKSSISQYFNAQNSLSNISNDKLSLLSNIEKLTQTARFTYINQEKQLGLGHAILMAQDYIKNDFFAVMLPDDIIISQKAALCQLIDLAMQQNASVIAVQEIASELAPFYGMIKYENTSNDLYQVSDIIEKPSVNSAPSNLAIVGRYVLSKEIFNMLQRTKIGTNNELQLSDALANLIKAGHKVYAYKIAGKRYDIGNPMGWLEANIKLAQNDPQYSDKLKEFFT